LERAKSLRSKLIVKTRGLFLPPGSIVWRWTFRAQRYLSDPRSSDNSTEKKKKNPGRTAGFVSQAPPACIRDLETYRITNKLICLKVLFLLYMFCALQVPAQDGLGAVPSRRRQTYFHMKTSRTHRPMPCPGWFFHFSPVPSPARKRRMLSIACRPGRIPGTGFADKGFQAPSPRPIFVSKVFPGFVPSTAPPNVLRGKMSALGPYSLPLPAAGPLASISPFRQIHRLFIGPFRNKSAFLC